MKDSLEKMEDLEDFENPINRVASLSPGSPTGRKDLNDEDNSIPVILWNKPKRKSSAERDGSSPKGKTGRNSVHNISDIIDYSNIQLLHCSPESKGIIY